jgi:hypothetical protein
MGCIGSKGYCTQESTASFIGASSGGIKPAIEELTTVLDLIGQRRIQVSLSVERVVNTSKLCANSGSTFLGGRMFSKSAPTFPSTMRRRWALRKHRWVLVRR